MSAPAFYDDYGRFIGPEGTAHGAHVAIHEAISANDPKKRQHHLGMLRACAEDNEALTLAVVEQYPLALTKAREYVADVRAEFHAIAKGKLTPEGVLHESLAPPSNVIPINMKSGIVEGRRVPTMGEFLALRAKPMASLVKGVLNQGTFATIYGDRGVGKTFVALDLAHAIACPQRPDWHGYKIKHGPVLYLAFEGAGGIAKRAQALSQKYGLESELRIETDCSTYKLRELAGRNAMGAMIAATFSPVRQPVLIVIDTFAHALHGGDENSAQDVGAFNTAALELVKNTGAAVVVIHHSGKNKANGPRGSSALGAAIDTELEIADKHVEATKQRDMEEGPVLDFALDSVPVGVDEDGDPVASCVVRRAAAGSAPRRAKLTPQVQTALDALVEAEKAAGVAQGAPVEREAWRAAFVRNEWPGEAPPPETERTAWKRVTKELKKHGLALPLADGRWQRAQHGGGINSVEKNDYRE